MGGLLNLPVGRISKIGLFKVILLTKELLQEDTVSVNSDFTKASKIQRIIWWKKAQIEMNFMALSCSTPGSKFWIWNKKIWISQNSTEDWGILHSFQSKLFVTLKNQYCQKNKEYRHFSQNFKHSKLQNMFYCAY